jgi:UDP-N-acetylmuramoyl-L-alanyl-D-glutamate--2,6-diaminopimelate ligase
MKLLKDVLYKASLLEVSGSTDVQVREICFDSRKAGEGSLFVAIRGTQSDGHRFIDEVAGRGAAAIVCEELPEERKAGITYVRVRDTASALSQLAANFYGNPSEKLILTGITGTNGKTTTATLLYRLFSDLGYACGLISTVRNRVIDQVLPATHTTPDPVQLNALLDTMVDAGCTHCFMEVSSHAVVQKRVEALRFAGGVFTNLTHEHLDYHKTFEDYLRAKKTFFDRLGEYAFALTNLDDKNGNVMLQSTRASKHTYSFQKLGEFRGRLIENHLTGLLLNFNGHEILCRLIGAFNAYNLLAVYATAVLLRQDREKVLVAMSKLGPVEGRFDFIRSAGNVIGVVDYAHTPDALQNVLDTIREVNNTGGKVITVVGCGGDRDRAKRPVMAKIACDRSDRVILTSDNPRTEDPLAILREMEKGVGRQEAARVLSIADRREAIKTACSLAAPGDIILVAGKGHEKYQEVNGVRTPFDDKKVLQEFFDLIVS